jgi:hypothetical protein
MKKSLSGHQGPMLNDEWLTPPEIVRALGEFDLDPCAPVVRPWDTAKKHYTKNDDGMAHSFQGRVWLNPPFGKEAIHWMLKMAHHRNGIALLAARTETRLFFETVWPIAHSILFLKGRPHFHYVDGTRAKANSGAPICLIAYGSYNSDALITSGLDGKFLKIK